LFSLILTWTTEEFLILDQRPETRSLMTNKDLDFSRLMEEERHHIPRAIANCATEEVDHE
jgi:hypothetical protein